MYRRLLLPLPLLCALTVSAFAQDAKSVIETAQKHIGNIQSVQYVGNGAQFSLGQSVTPGAPWPRTELRSVTRTIDYEKSASRNDGVGAQGNTLATQFLAGDKGWGQTGNNITPASPAATIDRQLQILLTPHGFLKAALANQASLKRGKTMLVTFTALGKYRVAGTIAADNTVEKVETWVDNAVLGDMHVEAIYSDYRDFNGFRFPAKIVQRQGGFPVLDLTITEAKTNVPLDSAVPDSVRQATPPAVRVTPEKVSDGVWYLTGGSHHSLVVEFADHVAVIEAPLNEERSSAVIAEVKKLVPSKPLRYLISTHHHFDHSGGLRTYIAEGATIVTHESNKALYERVSKAPHTLNPDRQAREKRKAKFRTMTDKLVLTDATRTVELHHIQGSPHATDIVMAWLPKEKLLAEVDVYSPLAANAPLPANPSPAMANLYENIQRLNLDVNQIAPLHGRIVTLAELKRTIGR